MEFSHSMEAMETYSDIFLNFAHVDPKSPLGRVYKKLYKAMAMET